MFSKTYAIRDFYSIPPSDTYLTLPFWPGMQGIRGFRGLRVQARDGVSFVRWAGMRVFHGRGNLRMPHELLDGDEIDAEANKAGGERVAKIVEAAAWNPGSPQRASESSFGVFDGSPAETEHMAGVGFGEAHQRLLSRVVDGNVADSAAL